MGFGLRTTLVTALLLISSQALAHKVNLFAYAEGSDVYVEGYFVDGKRAQNSVVQVFNPAGEMIAEGITDGEGQFRFPVPEKSDLTIALDAGMGHRSEFQLSADELGTEKVGVAASAHSHTDGGDHSHEHGDSHNHVDDDMKFESSDNVATVGSGHSHGQATMVHGGISAAELDEAVRQAVNEAIKPLVRELAESREKASLSSIMGGVGFIVGFLGLFAYFKAREKTQDSE